MNKFDSKTDEGVLLLYSLNGKAYIVFNKHSKTIMKSTNVVVDDQETIPTCPRSNESETKGPLYASGDDSSVNNATLGNRSNPNIEDALPLVESSSQSKDPTTSTSGSNRKASKQVQKDHLTTNII